jgi:hypothetical protein
MIKPVCKLPAATLLSLLLLLQGCTSMRPLEHVEGHDKLIKQIKLGDEIDITTKSGDKFRINVTSITKDKIAGENKEIKFEDVSQIEVSRFDAVKTGATVTGFTLYFVLSMVAILSLLF